MIIAAIELSTLSLALVSIAVLCTVFLLASLFRTIDRLESKVSYLTEAREEQLSMNEGIVAWMEAHRKEAKEKEIQFNNQTQEIKQLSDKLAAGKPKLII